MSQQRSPRDRWAGVRGAVSGTAAAGARMGPRLWGAIALGVVLVIALAVWVNSLLTPVSRSGQPTASVTALPAPTTAAPTPSGSTDPSASASPRPSTAPTLNLPKLKSSGKFDIADVNVAAASTSGELRRYSVRVETTAKLKANSAGTQIAGVLNDPRSWAGSGGVRFALVADPARADFSVTLAAPGTAAKACDPDAAGTCTDGADVVINAAFWSVTPSGFSGDRATWRAYLVNHGMGQLLGEQKSTCAKKGQPAPVMMPQAGALGGCVANPWPYP
ncbi:MAG: DUF3152 domain-containing protein [Propionicimonas sp.]